ncbi:RNA polymerase sigma-70 factor [Hymenobacter sp. HD11105]
MLKPWQVSPDDVCYLTCPLTVKLSRNYSGEGSAGAPPERQEVVVLFQQHASGLYRLAFRHLRSRIEAQEIVQECFLKFWEKRHEIGAAATDAKGYLYTCAYHAILNQVRHQHYWVYEDCSDDLIVEHEPQTSALEYEDLNSLYVQALTQLPAKRRRIFAMSRQQGLSNAKIAQELDISVKTVEAQMTQALKFLRHYFLAHGVVLSVFLLFALLYLEV